MLFLLEHQKIVSEGAGAVSTAALLSKKYQPAAGEKVVCIVSGGNVDEEKVANIILDDFRKGKIGNITLEKSERI